MVAFEIYSSRNCAFCKRAKRLLEKRGVSFVEIQIDSTEPDRILEMRKRSNGRLTVPQIFADTNVHIGGYEELIEWDRDGRLEKLASDMKQAT